MEILNTSLWKAYGFSGKIGFDAPDEDFDFEGFVCHLGAKTIADASNVYDGFGCEHECGKLEYIAPLVVYKGDEATDEMPLWLVRSTDENVNVTLSDADANLKDYVAAPTIAEALQAYKEQFTNPESIEVTSVTLIDYMML